MLGSVAGYAKYHYYLGTPEERRTVKNEQAMYKAKKRWVKIVRGKKKKYPMIIKEAK